jgi:hypothetical protein
MASNTTILSRIPQQENHQKMMDKPPHHSIVGNHMGYVVSHNENMILDMPDSRSPIAQMTILDAQIQERFKQPLSRHTRPRDAMMF